MAGGGMGGMSSTGYGQQSVQPNWGSNIDANHIMTDDFGSGSLPYQGSAPSNVNQNLQQSTSNFGDMLRGFPTNSLTGVNQQSVAPRNVTPVPQENQTFNADWYLKQNPDVAANTYFNANPYQHYLQYGRAEGRSPFAPQVSAPVTAPAPVQETPYIPVTTTFSTQQQGPTFNAPIVTQANEGAAVNYQYNRGGIASLVRR